MANEAGYHVTVSLGIVMRHGELMVQLAVDGRVLGLTAAQARDMGETLCRLSGRVEGLALARCALGDIGLSDRTIARAAVAMLTVWEKRDGAGGGDQG